MPTHKVTRNADNFLAEIVCGQDAECEEVTHVTGSGARRTGNGGRRSFWVCVIGAHYDSFQHTSFCGQEEGFFVLGTHYDSC